MKMVRFMPEHCEEWGVTPEDKFVVDRVSPSGKSVFVRFPYGLSHISLSILIMEETMADTTIRPLVDPSPHVEKAKALVWQYVMEHLEKTDPIPDFTVYEVTFTYTLGNWKAMISTSLPDKMYYEVTYDRANKCTYLDAYIKIDNRKIMDSEE